MATGDELMSTRGRANLIRAALEQRGVGRPAARDGTGGRVEQLPGLQGLHHANARPTSISPLLKAELLHARIQRDGLTWRERLFSSVDPLGTPRLRHARGWPTAC